MVQVTTLPLLLLLGLLGLLCPLWAIPPGRTPFQWFKIQHIQPKTLRCDRAMIAVNRPNKVCKPTNTFLHDTVQHVIDVCKQRSRTCKDGIATNCYKSAHHVSMTECQLLGKTQFPNCHYADRPKYKKFIVACDRPKPSDPQDPLVPVHLDEIVI